jgi:beta-galactosidase
MRPALILAMVVVLGLGAGGYALAQEATTPITMPGVGTAGLRMMRALNDNWRFIQDDDLSDGEALNASGEDWETVSLPHTWNAEDAAGTDTNTYKRDLGWYRQTFDTPPEGARHWLEFGAASLVADVWLNGDYLGQHRGGFTAFRFDITEGLAESGENELLVKVDNRAPADEDDVTAIDPMTGDFNVNGGLYRYVSLVSTAGPVHFDLGDLGGSGVYATTTAIAGTNATVNVLSKVASNAEEAGDYLVRTSLVDDSGQVAGSAEQTVRVEPDSVQDVVQDISASPVRLWQGREDPHQYDLVAEVLTTDGEPIDRVVQNFGIRHMVFDPNEGFFLNGEHVRLHGVAMHQDFLSKGWALSEDDWDTSFDLIAEVGANAVRLGHYPFPQYALEKANELGLIVWAEKPNGQSTTVEPCTTPELPEDYLENARLQLAETIRQQFNHAAVAVWGVGNEADFGLINCDDPPDTIRPYLQTLHELAKELDPSRATGYAEYGHGIERSGPFATEGITDVFGTNRYFLWYTQDLGQMGPILDGLHEVTTPNQPLGVTEYGIGSSLEHHTDNPRGGYPDIHSAPEGKEAYQPEEFAAWAHAQNYQVIESKDYLWGAFVWNMFDFGAAHRREGGLLGVNTKGLVTFDRETRKDPFFFYKANWSDEPVTYIVGRRYTDRAYAVNDVTVFSNANEVALSVNGDVVGTMTVDECPFSTCVFEDVELSLGDNTLVAVGDHAGATVRDEADWTLENQDVNIAAGQLITGLMSDEGERFGSDTFFNGGRWVEGASDNISNTDEPHLYERFRSGNFSYEIPLENGEYEVRLGFIEPYEDTAEGERIFDVTANGETILDDFDVRREAGDYRRVVTETFTVDVSDGLLELGFDPSAGEAVVSTIMISANDGEGGDSEP